MVRGCVLLPTVVLGLVGLAPTPIPAQNAHGLGTIAFRATVGGVVHDAGTVSTPLSMVPLPIGEARISCVPTPAVYRTSHCRRAGTAPPCSNIVAKE